MVEVEAGFKIKETKEKAEKILLKHGFENMFKTITHDIYFGKDVNFDGKSEEEIKQSLIRLRGFKTNDLSTFENLSLYDSSLSDDKIKVDFKTAISYVNKLFKSGYEVIFDTTKSDWVYKKGECYHQLQDIKEIGLVDYVYNKEIFGKGFDEQQQFEMLKSQMKDLGFHLEYELGIDKLRSLANKKLMFSTNQIGLYNYQKK